MNKFKIFFTNKKCHVGKLACQIVASHVSNSHLTFRHKKKLLITLAFFSQKNNNFCFSFFFAKSYFFCVIIILEICTRRVFQRERSTTTIFSRSFLESFHSPPPISSPLNDHGFLVQNQTLFDIGGRSSGFSSFNFVQYQIGHSWFDLRTSTSQLSGWNPHAGHLITPKS